MTQNLNKLDELREKILAGGMNRRDVLKRSLALGLSAPIIAGLLAACGDAVDNLLIQHWNESIALVTASITA